MRRPNASKKRVLVHWDRSTLMLPIAWAGDKWRVRDRHAPPEGLRDEQIRGV
jgi:hypothetical protein